MELRDQAGCLGRAENGRARAPQTDQSVHRHGDVINECRVWCATGREGGGNDQVKGKAPEKGL
eukprot:15464343-Alexandrium_andersonii.AAC.1